MLISWHFRSAFPHFVLFQVKCVCCCNISAAQSPYRAKQLQQQHPPDFWTVDALIPISYTLKQCIFSHITDAITWAEWDCTQQSQSSVFLWLIYDVVVWFQNLRRGHISLGVVPRNLSDNVGCRPSKPPEGKSVGSMVIVFSLFIV